MHKAKREECMRYNCVIIGDVNIDHVVDLSHITLQKIDNACINAPILSYVGGNGTFFAEAAKEVGFSDVKLIVSLGEDESAHLARSYFSSKEIELINFPSNKMTGKVIILYQPNDKRILVADRGSNKDVLLPAQNRLSDYVFDARNLLYISGYVFQSQAKKSILFDLILEYKKRGTFVIIDAVPHEIFQRYSWEEYKYKCRGIDGIVIERDTVIGFMKQPPAEYDDDTIADFLLSTFNFCIVRLNTNSDFLIADRSNRRVVSIFYKPKVASLRFTDRVIAQVVLRYIHDPNQLFYDSEWVNDVNNIIGEAK